MKKTIFLLIFVLGTTIMNAQNLIVDQIDPVSKLCFKATEKVEIGVTDNDRIYGSVHKQGDFIFLNLFDSKGRIGDNVKITFIDGTEVNLCAIGEMTDPVYIPYNGRYESQDMTLSYQEFERMTDLLSTKKILKITSKTITCIPIGDQQETFIKLLTLVN